MIFSPEVKLDKQENPLQNRLKQAKRDGTFFSEIVLRTVCS